MLDNNIVKLGKYAEELEKKEPIELINEYKNQIENKIDNLSEEDKNLGYGFGKETVKIIDNYKYKGTLDDLIAYHLLSLLVSFIKRSLIEEKANLLGIEKNLYKQEMRLLFKGKRK